MRGRQAEQNAWKQEGRTVGRERRVRHIPQNTVFGGGGRGVGDSRGSGEGEERQ